MTPDEESQFAREYAEGEMADAHWLDDEELDDMG